MNPVENKVKRIKEIQHMVFVSQNRKTFRFLDALMIVSVVCNLGALLITNALVFKQEPNKVLHEGNPVQAKLNGYQTSNEVQTKYWTLLKQAALLSAVFFGYLWFRWNVTNRFELLILTGFVLILSYILVWDFVNDLGFFVGKLLWGVQ